ncbi:MAG: RidA family protein [Actinomycetes bacterium]
MTLPSQRLAELGLALPEAARPLAAYVPATQVGDLIYTSGQLPTQSGTLVATGKLGEAVLVADGAGCARVAALNALAAAAAVAGGLDGIARVVKVAVFVASAPGFTEQAKVANGASELLESVFGEAGRHARSAVGVASLPLDAPVEVEMVLQLARRPTVQPVSA